MVTDSTGMAEAMALLAKDQGVTDETPGFAVAIEQDGKTVFRGAYGLADLASGQPLSADDNFIIASNTKQFTCLAMLMLAEAGELDLDAPVAPFFPDFPDWVHKVTPRQMMGHISGIRDYFEDADEGSEKSDALKALAHADEGEVLNYIVSLGDLEFAPNTAWAYSNSSYVMLGSIVRQITGIGFGAFLEQEVLRPLGMTQSFAPDDLVSRDRWLVNGYVHRADGSFELRPYDMLMVGFADGNISSNVDDLIRWQQWLWEGKGPELVSPAYKAQLTQSGILKDGRPTGYGLGLFLGTPNGACDEKPHLSNHQEVWHSGSATGFISLMGRLIRERLSVVVLCNDESLDRSTIYTKALSLALEGR